MPYSTSGRTVTYSYTHLMFLSIAGEAFGTPSATHRGIAQVQNPVIQSIPFEVKPAELLRAAKELQMEGVIAKCKGSLYEPDKRSGTWLKYKINKSQEFVIGGYTLGRQPPVRCADRRLL